ncbi:aspartate aminotransferase family protein [Helicobacter jaachi]|uniref:Aspartate aminotransferase family protein n=1 Tax=Helicobacter jaachi TaxID=1677920 RepID=A0A4U8TAA6_9HELI|nr:aspartate aminotransferase family protein [Helicobacter jaachi]TLD96759.1 aspartate aminotransferase family protein [Helicobacter jaachi]
MDLAQLQALDNEFVLHTYARYPVAFVRGENARLFDISGKEYVDFASGIGVCSVGHANARLAEVIAKQAKNLLHTSNLYYIEPQVRLAQRLVSLFCGVDSKPMRAFFCNSGAEANECAIKIARKYGAQRGAHKIITLDSSFHGRTIASLKATGQPKMHAHFGPYPDGFVYAKDIDDIYNHLDKHTCAVLLELVQGEGGIAPMDREKVKALSKHLRAEQILFMVDEVQSGVYRSGEIFASRIYGVQPDVISMAKGLAGGVPIGAVLTTLGDIFEYGEHGSTFGGNFLSCAAALEVLDILYENYTNGSLKERIIAFESALDSLLKDFGHIFLRRVGLGLMCGLHTHNADMLPTIISAALESGVIVLKSGKGVLRFLPALTIHKDDINEGFSRLREALANL